MSDSSPASEKHDHVKTVRNLYAAFGRRDLAADESVAVVGHTRCRATSTGRVYDSDFVHLVTFKNGQIARFQEFFDTYAAGETFRQVSPPGHSM